MALLPLALLNARLLGHPLGFRVESNLVAGFSLSSHLLSRPEVFYNLFLKASRAAWVSILLMGLFLIAFLLRPRITKSTAGSLLPAFLFAAFCCSAIALSSFLTGSSVIRSVMITNSLFVGSPILILAFLRSGVTPRQERSDRRGRFVWFLCLVFGILYGLSAPAVSSWGIHWGNRFLLTLYPLLAVLCAANLRDWADHLDRSVRWRHGLVVALVLLSLAAQVGSIVVLGRKKEFSACLNRTAQSFSEEVLVTNLTWVPQAMHSVFFTKKVFWVGSEDEYQRLLTKLRRHGFSEILFLTRPTAQRQPAPAAEIVDHDLRFFDLRVYHIDFDADR